MMSKCYTTIRDLNRNCQKKMVYLLANEEEVVGSTVKANIEDHLASVDSLISTKDGIESDEVILIHGFLLDSQKLPIEIKDDHLKGDTMIWVFVETPYNSIVMDNFDNLDQVTQFLNHTLSEDISVKIDDVAIIVGQDIGLVYAPAKSSMMTLTEFTVYTDK